MYTGRCVERTDLPQPPHLLIKQNRFQTLNTHSQQLYGSPNCQSMENMNFNQMSVNHGVCPQIIRYQRMLVQSQEVYYMYPRPRRSTISNHPSGCRTIAQRRLMNERINSSCNGNSVVFDNQFEPNSNVFRVNGGLYGENLQQSISRGEIERMTNANHPIEIYNNSLYQHVMKDRIKTAASEQLAPQMNSSRNLMDIINNNIGSSSRQCDGNLNLENFSSRQQDHTYSRQTSENFSYPDENRLMCAYCTNCQKAHNIYQQCQISNGQVQNLNLLKRKIPNQGIGSNNSKSSDDKTEIKSLLRKRLLQSALKDILNNGNDKTPDVSIQNGEFCPFVSDDSNIEGRCQGTSLTKTSNSTSTAKSTQKNKNTSLTKTSNSTSTAKSTQKNKKGTPVNGDNKSDCVNINEGNASPGKNICVPKKMSTSITDTGTTNPDDRHTVVNSDAQIAYLRAVEQWKMDHSYNSTTHIGKSKNSSCGPTHESLCDPSRDSSCNLTHDFTCGPTDKSSCDPSRDSSCNHTNDLTCDFIKDYSCDPSDETFFYSKDRICAINPEARLFHDRKKIDCNLSLEKGKSMNPECPVNNHENIKSSAPFCDENGTNKDGGGSKFVKALANIVKELFSHRKNKSKKAREQSEKIIESQMNKSNKAGDQSEKINDVITVGQMSPSQITKSKEKSETHSNETKNDNKIMSTDNTVLEGGIDKGNSPTRDLEKTSVLKSTDRNVFQCLFVPVNNTFIKSNLENSDGRSEDAVEYCLREDNTANIENLETNYGKQDEKEANVVDTEACCIKFNDKPQDKTEEIETVPTYEINALNVTSSDLNSNMEVGEGHFINDREYSNTNTEIGTRNDSETYKKKSSLSNLDNGDNAQTAGKDFSFLELGYCPIALPLGCHEYDEESEKDDNNNELLETSFKDENNVNRNKYMVKLCNNKYNHDKTEVLRPWILTKLDEIPKPTVWKEFLEKMDRDNTMVYTESNHVDLEETIASPDFDEERDHVYDLNLSRIIESPSSSPSVDNANESLSEWKECNSQLSQVTKEEKNQIKQRKSSYETQEEKNQPEVDQENNLNNYQMVSDVMINIADDDNKQFANFETRNDKFDLKENAMKQNSINLQPTTGEIINNLSTPCSKNINDEKLPSNDNKEMSLQNRTLENENENRFMYDKPSCVVDSVLMNKAMDMSCQLNNINSNLQISEKADRKIESARKNVKTGGKKYRSTDAKLLEEAMHFICSGKSEDESTRAMIKCFYSGPISTRRQKSTFPTVGEMKQGKKYGRQSNVNTLKEQRKQKLSEEFVHDNEVVVVDKTDKDYIHKDAEMVFDKTDEDYVHKTGEMVVDRTDKDYVHKTGEMVVDKTDIDYVCKDAEMVVDKKESVKDKVPTTIPNIKNNDLKHENELRIVLADSNADSNSKNITFHENSQQKLRTNISEKESEALTGLLTLGNGHVLDSFIKDYEYDCRNDAWKKDTGVLDSINDALKKISREHDNRNVTVEDTGKLNTGNDTTICTEEYDKNVTVEDTCVLDNRNDPTVDTGKCDIRNVTAENTSVLDIRNDALKKISGEHDNRNVTVKDTDVLDSGNDTNVSTAEYDKNVTVEDTCVLDNRNDTTVGTGKCDIRNVTVENTSVLDSRNDALKKISGEHDNRNVTVEDTGLLDIRNDTTVGTRECDIRNVTVEDTGLLDIRNDTTVGTRECDIRNVTVEDTGLLDIRNDSTVVIRECDIRNVTVEDTGLLDIRNDTTVGTGEPNSRNDTTVGTGEPSRKNDTTVGTDEPHSRNDTLKVVTGAYKSRNDTTVGTGEPPSRNDTLKVVTGAYKSGNDTTENKSECYTGNNTMEDINGGNETWKATRELDSKNDTLKDTAESSCGNNKLKKNIDDWESGNDTLNKKSGHYTLDKGVTPNIQNTCSLKEQAKTDYVYLGKECSTRLSVQDIADREFDVNDQSLGSEISAQNSTEKEYVTTAFIQNIDVSKTRNCTDCISQHEIERAEDVKLETRHENETSNLSNKIDFDSLNDIVEGVAETMSSIEQETFITHETIQNTLKQLRSNNCTQTANTSDLEENEVFFKTNTSYLSELDAAGDNSSTSADENPLRLQTRGKAIKECNFEDIIEKRIEQLLQEVKEKRNSGKLVGKVLENYDNCSISTTVMVRENVISEVNVVQTVSEDNSANDLRNVQNQNSCCSTEGDDDDDIIPATEKPRHVENSSGKWLIPILERLNIDISKGRVIVTKSAQKLFLKSHVQTHSSRPVTTLPKFASFGIEEDSHSTKNGSGLMRIDEVVKYDDVNTSKSKKRKKINSLDETIMELRSSAASSNVKAKKQKTKTEETDVHASTKITRNKARKTLKAFKLGNEEKEIKDKKMKSTKKNYLSISTADDMENIDSASKDKTDLTCDASNNTNKSKKTAKRKLKFDKELNEPRCKVSVAEDNPLGTVKNNINMKMAEKKTTKHRKKLKPYSAELLRREENLEFDCEKSLTHVNEKLTSYQQGEPLSLNSTEETKSPVHLNKDGIKRKKKVKDGLKNFKPKSAKKSGKNLSEPKVKSLKKISANKLKKFDATKKTEDGKVKFRLVTEPSEQKIIKLKADALKKMYAVKTCGYCHKIVPSRQYSYHVKSRHPYRCAKCGILFQTKTEKTAHRREKHNLERYHCLTCNQFFDLKFHYQVHVKSTRHINTRDIYRRAINWMKSCLGLGSSSHENLPMLTDGHTTILDSSQNALVPAGQVGFLFSEAEDVPFSDHEPEVKALLHDLSDVKSQLLSNANNVSNFQYGQSAIFECNTFSGKMVQNYVSNTTFYASDNAQFADFPVSALRNQDNFSVLSQNSFATNSDNFSVASQNSLSIENHDYSSSSSTIDLNESSYMENSNNELNNGAENMDFPELSNTSSTATKGLLSDVFHLLENDGYFESDEFKYIDLERNIDLSDIDIAEELCELSNVELSHLTKDLNAMQNNNLYNQIIDSTDNYTLLDISTPNVPGRNKSDMTSRHFTVSNLHSDFRSDTLSPASVTTLGDHQDLPFSQNSVSSVEAEFNAILQDIAQSESMGV